MEYELTGSVVVYENDPGQVRNAIDSFLATTLKATLYVIDNSRSDRLRATCESAGSRVEYIFNNRNLGFAAGHNLAMRRCLEKSRCHLVFNPDVHFGNGVLEALYGYMERNPTVGVVMPKVTFPDGSIQYLCKNLPTPGDLILRRFAPGKMKGIFRVWFGRYEFRDRNYNDSWDVPFLSGCFLFLRSSVLREMGVFDERYFMYLEDVDLCRRIGEKYRTVYYPAVSICHDYAKGSYRNIRLLYYHSSSALKYFNKWGWFPFVRK
jgi:GT2 family glycosyltransferase